MLNNIMYKQTGIKAMNWHMGEVLPGLYVGNYRDSKDHTQLERFKISHIIAIHDSPRRLLPDKHYLCVMASDTPDQNLSQYFSVCNDFIHAARLREGNVLIHCLAGMSRSVTVAVAYIMTATHLNWKEALKVVRAGRAVANPNTGFQNQLQEFEQFKLSEERRRLRERFPSSALEQLDRMKVVTALDNYQELLQNRDICEGNCSRGEKCPTGASEGIEGGENLGGEAFPKKNVAYAITFEGEQWISETFKATHKDSLDSSFNEGSLIFGNNTDQLLMPNVRYYDPDSDKGRFVNNIDWVEDFEDRGQYKIDWKSVCNMDPSKGLFRRRPSSGSTHSRLRGQSSNANASSSTLSVISVAAQSCPTSPKHSLLPLPRRSVGSDRIPEDDIALEDRPTTSSEAAEYAAAVEDARREQEQRKQQLGKGQRSPRPGGSTNTTPRVGSAGSRRETRTREGGGPSQLQRSVSTVSGFGVRPRSSPAGLHAYTGSVPSSVNGSRVDLRDADKGSAIYLGCSAPRASTLSISSSRGSSGGSAPPSPSNTPPSSPRHGLKRSTSLAKKPR